MTQFGLSDKTLETVRAILATCPELEKALVYGSRAMGNYRTGSDIDITLIGAQLNMDMLFKLVRLFDESNLPYMVDLSITANINNPNLIDHIKRVGHTRWKQRFDNFDKAFNELTADIALRADRPLSRIEEKGLIQSFEMTHELAWNVLKDYLREKAGTTGLFGSKDTTREAFKQGLIEEGDIWIAMVQSRNMTSHVYDQAIAKTVIDDSCSRYYGSFKAMHERCSLLRKAS